MDDLAAMITSEHGKTLSDSIGEMQRGMEVVEFAIGAPQPFTCSEPTPPASRPLPPGGRP
jgi:acyl-CoA reductase-like NAD-dependent aldehyde dehydrogenase